jgi:hypothetical protein
MPDKQPSPSHEALRFFNKLAKELYMLSNDKSFRVSDFVINLFDAEFAQLRAELDKLREENARLRKEIQNLKLNFDVKYRIKPELKLREFRPEEVPVGVLFKTSENELPLLITEATKDGWIHIGNNTLISSSSAKKGQYSYDFGRTWRPFGVMK